MVALANRQKTDDVNKLPSTLTDACNREGGCHHFHQDLSFSFRHLFF